MNEYKYKYKHYIYILYIYMNKNQIEFLSKDNIGLKEGTFSTTKHIA